jgi:hypothetical protein
MEVWPLRGGLATNGCTENDEWREEGRPRNVRVTTNTHPPTPVICGKSQPSHQNQNVHPWFACGAMPHAVGAASMDVDFPLLCDVGVGPGLAVLLVVASCCSSSLPVSSSGITCRRGLLVFLRCRALPRRLSRQRPVRPSRSTWTVKTLGSSKGEGSRGVWGVWWGVVVGRL